MYQVSEADPISIERHTPGDLRPGESWTPRGFFISYHRGRRNADSPQARSLTYWNLRHDRTPDGHCVLRADFPFCVFSWGWTAGMTPL